jgi:hypothetical protein
MHCADENDGKLSDCCWAKIRLDRCSDCKEFCSPEDTRDYDLELEERKIRASEYEDEKVKEFLESEWIWDV